MFASFFLPWASVGFGDLQLKGQYFDYSWVAILAAVLLFTIEIALANKQDLAIAEAWQPKMERVQNTLPFLHLSYVVAVLVSVLFSDLHAIQMVSYGYWLAILSALSLIWLLGARGNVLKKFLALAVIVTAATVGITYGWMHYQNTKAVSHPTGSDSGTSSSSGVDTGNAPTSVPNPSALDATPYIKVTSVIGKTFEKNVEAERFSDSLEIVLGLQNISDKTITGIRGRVTVSDAFNKEAYSFTFKDDDKIAPQLNTHAAYSFDHNQFEDDDPYSKMINTVQADTAKYQVQITNIAFSDGTTLPQ
jgi:hypothetical protein